MQSTNGGFVFHEVYRNTPEYMFAESIIAKGKIKVNIHSCFGLYENYQYIQNNMQNTEGDYLASAATQPVKQSPEKSFQEPKELIQLFICYCSIEDLFDLISHKEL